MWLLAQDPINGAVSPEVFNWVVGAAATIILALVAAIGILYRAGSKDRDERLTDIKDILKEQKDILTGALETTNKVGTSIDGHTKALDEVKRALELNTEVLHKVRQQLHEED
jgi:septal ring factor EnvC (AmiA/AmiB activator)